MSHGHFRQDENVRRRSQDPHKLLRGIGVAKGMVFVDIGCGAGFFSIPAAEMVGEGGKVYAVDVNPAFLEEVEKRASALGLKNVVLKAASAEEAILFDSRADIVFFANAFHDFEDKERVLANSMRMLKQGGETVDLDWKKTNTTHGPPLWKRLPEKEVERLMSVVGFRAIKTTDCGKGHYLIVGKKS